MDRIISIKNLRKKETTPMIEMGVKVKDKVTGFTGCIIARHIYITGCDVYSVSPGKMLANGDLPQVYDFDEGRLDILKGGRINPETLQVKASGGPHEQGVRVKG